MKNTEQEILAYAKAQAPLEMCGFLLRDYMDGTPFSTLAKMWRVNRKTTLKFPPKNRSRRKSSAGLKRLSIHTLMANRPCRLPMSQSDSDWILVCDGKLHLFPKIQPLVGREFVHGETDYPRYA